jgi:hypothetical protein
MPLYAAWTERLLVGQKVNPSKSPLLQVVNALESDLAARP